MNFHVAEKEIQESIFVLNWLDLEEDGRLGRKKNEKGEKMKSGYILCAFQCIWIIIISIINGR